MKNNPYIIPFFIPFLGCPHKCIYCNQALITGTSNNLPGKDFLFSSFKEYLSFPKKKPDSVEIAFFGGNFLGMKKEEIIFFLDSVKEFADLNQDINFSIRFSTRPDTISYEKIDLITDYPVSTIELGIQSMDDHVLKKSGRGHSSEDSKTACRLIRSMLKDVNLGLQVMPGLPGENAYSRQITLEFIEKTAPEYLRIYPTVVLKDTALEKLYAKKEFIPLSLDEAIEISSNIYDLCMKTGTSVIRMGLPHEASSNDSIVAGPWHPSFGELVIQKSIYKKLCLELEKKGKVKSKDITLAINPASESLFRGWKNSTVKTIQKDFGIKSIEFKKDNNLSKNEFNIHLL